MLSGYQCLTCRIVLRVKMVDTCFPELFLAPSTIYSRAMPSRRNFSSVPNPPNDQASYVKVYDDAKFLFANIFTIYWTLGIGDGLRKLTRNNFVAETFSIQRNWHWLLLADFFLPIESSGVGKFRLIKVSTTEDGIVKKYGTIKILTSGSSASNTNCDTWRSRHYQIVSCNF